jgi:peptidoglycan/LPS O-acetylase OafA/YrhL
MRISLVFPLFCSRLYRLRLGTALMALAGLSVVGALLALAFPAAEHEFVTLHYAALFGVGALIARHLPEISTWYLARSARDKCLLWGIASLLLVSRTHNMVLKVGDLADVPVALGGALLIILSINSPVAKNALHHRIPIFLGSISYSLYLVHVTLLFVAVHLLYGRLPASFIFVLYCGGSIAMAWLFRVVIESPSNRLGKRLGRSLDARYRAPRASTEALVGTSAVT